MGRQILHDKIYLLLSLELDNDVIAVVLLWLPSQGQSAAMCDVYTEIKICPPILVQYIV